MDAATWLDRYAAALGVPTPTDEQKTALLSLASVAANASERLVAPLSCWLAAVAGRGPAEALALAREVAASGAQAESAPGPAGA